MYKTYICGWKHKIFWPRNWVNSFVNLHVQGTAITLVITRGIKIMSVLQTLCPRHLFSLCCSQVFNVSRHWLNWTNLFSTGSQCVNVCVCVYLNYCVGQWLCFLLCDRHKAESSEELMGISTGRNTWRVWGENTNTQLWISSCSNQLDVRQGGEEERWKSEFTSGCFRSELRVKVECVIWSTSGWFKRRVNFSPKEFLMRKRTENVDSLTLLTCFKMVWFVFY